MSTGACLEERNDSMQADVDVIEAVQQRLFQIAKGIACVGKHTSLIVDRDQAAGGNVHFDITFWECCAKDVHAGL